MCGIGGVVGHAEAIPRQLDAMLAAMRHRGPDADGSVTPADGIGLCATRLAIQDLSEHGRQPMGSDATGSTIVFNGEIYNVAELHDTLEAAGRRFRGHSDTEVILAAYDEWGLDCVARLHGMFAFAIFDPRDGSVALARDRLGIKPLYFSTDNGLVFASEVRTLLAAGVPAELDVDGLAQFLQLGSVVEPSTLIKGVRSFPPGHVGRFRGGELTLSEYWSLENAFARQPETASPEDAAATIREALAAAVERHLVGDVPAGFFLSGGIDSTALVALAREVTGEPPRTLSLTFNEPEFSESRYSRLAADRFGTDHTEVLVDAGDFRDTVHGMFTAMDQPSMDGLNTHVISKIAHDHGWKVALSGLGADELLGGYDSFREVPRLAEIGNRVPAPLRPAAALAGRLRYGNTDRGRKLARWLRTPGGLGDAYALHREMFGSGEIADLTGHSPNGQPGRSFAELGAEDPVNFVSACELDRYLRSVLLRDSDSMSMAHSLELRVPFLDDQLLGLVASLSGQSKVGAQPKPLLTAGMRDHLPAELVDRPKMGFVLPLQQWMHRDLRDEVANAMNDPEYGGQVAAALDGDEVVEIWNRFLDGHTNFARPWTIYVAKVWGERHLSGASQ